MISLANRPAGLRERRFVFVATVALFLAFAATAPFADMPLPEFDAFVPSSSAVMLINDLITSILLYSQCSIAPSRSFLVLASGYLFTALIIVPHALTFPGAFTATGLIGAGPQTSPWLFFSAHFVFPAVLFSYARLKHVDRANPLRASSTRTAISVSVALVVVLACGLILVTTAGEQYLPVILTDRTHALRVHLLAINFSIIGITAIALIELWTRRHTVLDYWLVLICVAIILEEACFSLLGVRFTLGFYVGRVFWLVTSIVVLILLLQETARLYARLARSYALLERERDSKLANARAIAAMIAHEARQPLTAITASGGAAMEYLRKTPPDEEKARSALHRIISEGHRTSDVIDGIRALFERGDRRIELIDFNDIIVDVLESLREEMTSHEIVIFSELVELPLVEGCRNQLRQVVFNLVRNALEAMQATANRRRVLRVTTERRERATVAMVVEDSGSGINPTQLDSIFNAFVTTKPHGTGLGLAICREVVEHHGGQLLASSDGASGAQFQVILPIRSTDSPGTHA